jgi:predicted dienelactone hydrolase
MNYLVRILLCVLSLSAGSLSVHADETLAAVTKELVDLGQLPSGRPAKITLWFPQGQCAALPNQQLCLAESAITDRTLVFSHGAMGAAENYNWIAESLAAAGYVVVGINHYGESWLYGQDTQNVRATAMVWQRPADISAIYDALSNRELFQKSVNWSNIIALGHSSGGQTVAMLAGVQYDLLHMMDFCKTEAAKNDNSCHYGIRNAPKPSEAFLQKFGGTYADARVKKIIMIDPTLGYGATPESLANVQLPILIIGAQNNDFLPWENHGTRYAKGIKNSKLYLLTGEEGHFIFLDACNNDIRVMGVPLCKDRTGVDRAVTHAALIPPILEFVRENNIVVDASKKFVEGKKAIINFEKITQILMYTPRWVFGLLAGLIVLGLIQARTRQVPIKAVFIVPVAMTMMSLIGTLMDLGFTAITISCWLLGAASITLLLLKIFNNSSAAYDHTTRKLRLQGSWIPLLVILAIFCTRYALGMSFGMNLNIVHEFYFAPLMSLILGALSGYFIAQGFKYLQVVRRTVGQVAPVCP